MEGESKRKVGNHHDLYASYHQGYCWLVNSFENKDKCNNNLTIQVLVQAQDYQHKCLQKILRVGEVLVGKTLLNGCQFAPAV